MKTWGIVIFLVIVFGPRSAAKGDDHVPLTVVSPEVHGQSIEDLAVDEGVTDPDSFPFSVYYYAVFQGPGLKNPSVYQPTPSGERDLDRPVLLKNYLSVGYGFSEEISLGGTAYWTWQPGPGRQWILRDPFMRLSHNSVISGENINLYADLRAHFPITELSRENDLLAGFQTFQVLTYEIRHLGLLLGLYGSARGNFFGKQGNGNDWEFYLGPNINYQATPNLAFNLLYEMGASHVHGDKPFRFVSDGTDLQPGVTWDVTPSLTINPYLNVFPQDGITLKNSSLGLFVSWKIL